jgi:hypothetical protein
MFNKYFWGIVFLIIGISLIAQNFQIPFLKDLWKFWPLIFVYFGIKIIYNSKRYSYKRRIKMREERYKILRLVQEGRITAEEAEELLKKLEESQNRGKRLLLLKVIENGNNIVNISIPLSLAKWGLKFANTYAEKYGEKIDFSPEELEELISNPDFKGKIVDINVPEKNTQVIVEIA